MSTLNLRNPNGYDGSPATQYKQGIVRFATSDEVTAGTANNVAVTVQQLNSVSTGANFASPPVLGFGSTTPRPVHATTLSAVGTTTINTSGAATTTIGTGGTGAVAIGNATGNTAVTGTLTSSAGITASTGNIVATAGQVNAGTSMTAATTITATLGAITATNGDLVLGTAGNKLSIATGSDASIGTSVAMTAGTVTISTTAVTANSKIFLTANTLGGTPGTLSAPIGSIVPAMSFDIVSSSNLDTSTVNWLIIN